jgi:hypothetical protein
LFSRSKKEEFLYELENWINEVIEQKANGHNNKIPTAIKTGFHNSMKANAEFHHEVADMLDNKEDIALVKYHILMQRIYKSICS